MHFPLECPPLFLQSPSPLQAAVEEPEPPSHRVWLELTSLSNSFASRKPNSFSCLVRTHASLELLLPSTPHVSPLTPKTCLQPGKTKRVSYIWWKAESTPFLKSKGSLGFLVETC